MNSIRDAFMKTRNMPKMYQTLTLLLAHEFCLFVCTCLLFHFAFHIDGCPPPSNSLILCKTAKEKLHHLSKQTNVIFWITIRSFHYHLTIYLCREICDTHKMNSFISTKFYPDTVVRGRTPQFICMLKYGDISQSYQ